MYHALITLHVTGVCLVVGTLFVQSLAVIFLRVPQYSSRYRSRFRLRTRYHLIAGRPQLLYVAGRKVDGRLIRKPELCVRTNSSQQ